MVQPRPSLGLLLVVGALFACKLGNKPAGESTPVASAQQVTAKNEIAFVKRVPSAGSRPSLLRKTTTKFTMGGKTYRETSVVDANVLVKAADEFRITKGSLEVKDLFTTSQVGTGSEKKSVSPLAGSTYVVTRSDDGKLSAQDGNGNNVPSTTLKLIKSEFGDAFEKSQDSAFLPDRAVKLEEKLTPSSDVMLKMLGIKDDGSALVDGTEFFLKQIIGDRALFDATFTLTQKVAGSGLRVRAKLKGAVEMQINGAWLRSVDLKGPLTIIDGNGSEKGSGDLSLQATQTY